MICAYAVRLYDIMPAIQLAFPGDEGTADRVALLKTLLRMTKDG